MATMVSSRLTVGLSSWTSRCSRDASFCCVLTDFSAELIASAKLVPPGAALATG